MRRKRLSLIWYYLSMLMFSALVVIVRPVHQNGGPASVSLSRGRSLNTDGLEESPYYIDFALSRHPAGNINCYRLNYQPTDINTVKLYASFFNMPEDFEEDEESYTFTGAEGKLTVYKFVRQFHFEAAKNADCDDMQALTEEAIINRAVTFMESHLLAVSHDEVRVTFNGKQYTVTLIDRIGNLLNYAFNPTVTLDENGCVLQADYFFIQYERLCSCKIKSMWDAFSELPEELPGNAKVRLTSCRLTYIYENSIVQPAYFFEGEVSGGESFAYFVKAAIYGT